MDSEDSKHVSSKRPPSETGVEPPDSQSLLSQARDHCPSMRNEWSWSGWKEAHKLRKWKWDAYRHAAYRELPLSFEYNEEEDPKIDYIEIGKVVDFLSTDKEEDPPAVKLVVSFTRGICPPWGTMFDSAMLSTLAAMFHVQRLQDYYPSKIVPSFSRSYGSDKTTQIFASSTGNAAAYPIITVTSYNSETDVVRGYFICDIGSFDHFALLGISSQIRSQRHPLLIQVLAVERSFECIMSDLEYLNNHTIVDNVVLDQEYADKVAEYRAFWAAWQSRLSMIQKTGTWLLNQLNSIQEWAPTVRVEQYSANSIKMRIRLEHMLACCEWAAVLCATVNTRLAAWQDASFRKSARDDSRITMKLANLTVKDGSTMKLLAFLGTIFLPATFVSSFFSMPLLDWKASSVSAITGRYFWLWWAVMIPLTLATIGTTMLWIRLRIGRRDDHIAMEI